MRLPPVRVPPIDLVPVCLPLLTQTSMLVVRSQSIWPNTGAFLPSLLSGLGSRRVMERDGTCILASPQGLVITAYIKFLPDDLGCDAWRGKCLTGRRDRGLSR
jgi:hypothetical protein